MFLVWNLNIIQKGTEISLIFQITNVNGIKPKDLLLNIWENMKM